MVLQDKYKRANSSRYRATHGGIESNRAKSREKLFKEAQKETNFPALVSGATPVPVDQEESSSELHSRFSRRQLASNADRYEEPNPDPDFEPEPEIDLSSFLEKQISTLTTKEDEPTKNSQDDDDIDHSFDHLYQHSQKLRKDSKPTKIILENPDQLGLVELAEDRKKAEATRELLARFTGRNNEPAHNSKHSTKSCHRAGQTPTKVVGLVGPLNDEAFLDEVLNDSSGTYGKFKTKK